MSERLVADLATIRPRCCVLSEVVAQVAALAEGCSAALVLATEKELDTVCVLVAYFHDLVPVGWDTVKIFND